MVMLFGPLTYTELIPNMPKVDFNFSGWVRNAEVTTATNIHGNTVDVSKMNSDELAKKLEKGELSISLKDYLNKTEEDVEVFDFEGAGYFDD